MDKDIKISVVMATYNGVDFIEKAINSVLSQSFKNFELIVVDDGSTDIGTKEKLQPYIEKKLIKYFYKKNGGQGSARNLGVKESVGKYIAFIDDDDYWSYDKLERQFNCINGTDLIGCYTDSFIIDPNGEIKKRYAYKIFEGNINKKIIRNNFITLSSSMVLKESFNRIGGFDESNDCLRLEDYDLWMRLSSIGNFCFIKEPLTFYRTRIPLSNKEKCVQYKKLSDFYIKYYRKANFSIKYIYCISIIISYLKYFYFRFKSLKN